jgi:hypothetical protein
LIKAVAGFVADFCRKNPDMASLQITKAIKKEIAEAVKKGIADGNKVQCTNKFFHFVNIKFVQQKIL